MNRLNHVLRFAEFHHRGQVDKAGKPYIFHLARVADRVETEHEKIVALLHDVVEDTDVSPIEIGNRFGKKVQRAVTILSRPLNGDTVEYYARIGQFTDTYNVKMADIADNMDADRLSALPDKQQVRLRKKYLNAIEQIEKSRSRTL